MTCSKYNFNITTKLYNSINRGAGLICTFELIITQTSSNELHSILHHEPSHIAVFEGFHRCEQGFAVNTTYFFSWESDGGLEKGPLMLVVLINLYLLSSRWHTCQLSLFNRDSPYFDPRKSRKKEQFYHMSLFLQKSVCSNVRKFRNVPVFEDFSPICPYF